MGSEYATCFEAYRGEMRRVLILNVARGLVRGCLERFNCFWKKVSWLFIRAALDSASALCSKSLGQQ